jgi:aminopeptidase N
LNQLNYVIGDEAFGRGMLDYFNTWKYKHPNPNDFKRIMERASDLELDWYFENWVGTTKTIDYGIKSVVGNGNQTTVMLERVGEMPMPVDVIVTYKDSTRENFYIPMRIMRGEKPQEFFGIKQFTQSDWPWVYPEYSFRIPKSLDNILSIEIDPTTRMADVDRSNNVYPSSAGLRFMGKGVEK